MKQVKAFYVSASVEKNTADVSRTELYVQSGKLHYRPIQAFKGDTVEVVTSESIVTNDNGGITKTNISGEISEFLPEYQFGRDTRFIPPQFMLSSTDGLELLVTIVNPAQLISGVNQIVSATDYIIAIDDDIHVIPTTMSTFSKMIPDLTNKTIYVSVAVKFGQNGSPSLSNTEVWDKRPILTPLIF